MPIPARLQTLIEYATSREASDLHLNVDVFPVVRNGGKLFYLEEMGITTDADVEQVLSSVLTSAQMENYKKLNELDFSLSYQSHGGKNFRFRGNAHVALGKTSIALRLTPPVVRSIDDLNLPPVLKEISKSRRGLFLVTGPTGHGKSTTLAAIINELNNTREDHIITIEDPVEFIHRSNKCLISQRELGSDTRSFSESLRSALRHDPNVILIGELRDLDTIRTAITAAETGHFVLSTLHTHDAAQSINRLIDVFPNEQQTQIRTQLATVLVGFCAQQLIPLSDDAGGKRLCATELLIANPGIRNCIREGKTSQIRSLMQTGVSAGMHTMEQCLASFVKSNVLSTNAALTYAYDPSELRRLLTTHSF